MASNTGNMGDGDNPSSSKVDGDHIEGSIASENNRNNDSLHVSNKHNFFLSLLGLKYESQPEKPTGQEGAANKKADEGFAVPQIDPESDEAVSKLDNGTLPQGSVSFEVLLKKAVSLLKEKTDRDEQVANLRDQISTLWGKIESLQQQNRAIREKSVRMVSDVTFIVIRHHDLQK
ncbi:hypothetical protein AB6A40_011320 [Gnathostoma spinigerum]|uniref:Uncharacterized protein n=1 Tax=Gnathostoma spinigerum TaxID=75299 RepID=A0ABD6F2S0_9BILA